MVFHGQIGPQSVSPGLGPTLPSLFTRHDQIGPQLVSPGLGPALPSLFTRLGQRKRCSSHSCVICVSFFPLCSTFPSLSAIKKIPHVAECFPSKSLFKMLVTVQTFNDRKPCTGWIFIPFHSKEELWVNSVSKRFITRKKKKIERLRSYKARPSWKLNCLCHKAKPMAPYKYRMNMCQRFIYPTVAGPAGQQNWFKESSWDEV